MEARHFFGRRVWFEAWILRIFGIAARVQRVVSADFWMFDGDAPIFRPSGVSIGLSHSSGRNFGSVRSVG